MSAYEHQPLKIFLIVFTAVALVVVFVINGIAIWESPDNPIFDNRTGDISDKYDTEITPAGWAFSIWGVIYAWQGVWVIYACSTICRRGFDGYLYCCPPYLPLAIYPIYIINLGLNAGWLVLFDREQMIPALPVLALMAFTLYICLGLCVWGVHRYGPQLRHYGLGREVWWVRLAVQNGLAIYAAWTSIATLLNLAIVLIYETDKDPTDAEWREDVCTICLGLLSFELLLWFILDLTVLDRFTRYVFTPHLVVTFALTAILSENWDSESRNSIMEVAMLGAAALATLTKLVVMLWRSIAEEEDNRSQHLLQSAPDYPTDYPKST